MKEKLKVDLIIEPRTTTVSESSLSIFVRRLSGNITEAFTDGKPMRACFPDTLSTLLRLKKSTDSLKNNLHHASKRDYADHLGTSGCIKV